MKKKIAKSDQRSRPLTDEERAKIEAGGGKLTEKQWANMRTNGVVLPPDIAARILNKS